MSEDQNRKKEEVEPESHDTVDDSKDQTPDRARNKRYGSLDADFVLKTTVLSRNNPILRRALSHQSAAEHDGSPDEDGEESTPDGRREVLLVVRNMVERVMMVENQRYKLGRFDLAPERDDEVDLTPYGAMDRGVSRVHAEMHIEGRTVYITDLESTNGTYIGGSRLQPHEPTPLQKGDELLLGRLPVQVMFH